MRKAAVWLRMLKRLEYIVGNAKARLMGVKLGRGTRISCFATVEMATGGTVELGKNCTVYRGALLAPYGGSIRVGDGVTINPYTIVYGQGGVTIGNEVMIAGHSVIIPANHRFDREGLIRSQGLDKRGIVIKDNVWIAAGVRVLDGVTIESGCVVGAGAVVTKSLAAEGLYVGVPARLVGSRIAAQRKLSGDAH